MSTVERWSFILAFALLLTGLTLIVTEAAR